jgi:hypothetical protein
MNNQAIIIDNPELYVSGLLRNIMHRRNLEITETGTSSMGGWHVTLQNLEFVVHVGQDRAGDIEFIAIGSRVRRKPRAQMRGPWSLSHLRGFLDGQRDHRLFHHIQEQSSWLEENENQLFDSSLLNSDDLNTWAVNASRRMFGQDTRK